MSNFKIKVILRFLEIVMQSVIFISIDILISFGAFKYQENELNRCFMIVIPVIFAYFIRRRFYNFFIYLGALIIMYADAYYYARGIYEVLFYFILVTILVAYTLHIKMKNTRIDNERISVFAMVIIIISYFIGMKIQSHVIMQSSLFLLIFFVIAQLLYSNLIKVQQVMFDNRDSVNFPAKQLYRVNLFMIITSVFAVLMSMLIFYSGPYGNIFQIIKNLILKVIGFILKLIFSNAESADRVTEPFEYVEEETDYEDFRSYNDDNSFANVLNTLFIMFTIAVIVIIIIYIIVNLIQFFRSFRRKRKVGADLVEFINPVNGKKKQIMRKRIKEVSESDMNLKLRKIYKTKVKKGIGKEKIKPSALPGDITLNAISKEIDKAKVVTDIYEKARYSHMEVSPEEIEKVKNIKNTK